MDKLLLGIAFIIGAGMVILVEGLTGAYFNLTTNISLVAIFIGIILIIFGRNDHRT